MGAEIEFKINTDTILKEMNDAAKTALELVGGAVEGHAKENETAIDTGRLRNSITWALAGESAHIESYSDDQEHTFYYSGTAPSDSMPSVYVGTEVEYAKVIEENGGKSGAGKDFLRNAALNHGDEYKEIVQTVLTNA